VDEEHHVVAGVLKLYLRELPDPLMCQELYFDWISALDEPKNQQKAIQQLKLVVSKLPKTNFLVFKSLLDLLVRIVARQHKNKMSSPNVAICWAPNVLKSRDQRPEAALIEATAVVAVFTFILDNHSILFGEILNSTNNVNSGLTTTTTSSKETISATTTTTITITATTTITATSTTNARTGLPRPLPQPPQHPLQLPAPPPDAPPPFHPHDVPQ